MAEFKSRALVKLKGSRGWQILTESVWRHLVTFLHDSVLNWRGKRQLRTARPSAHEGAELRKHGFQLVRSENVAEAAKAIAGEIGQEQIEQVRDRMLAQPDGPEARRGDVPLMLSKQTTLKVLRLATSDEILRPVTSYLGIVPKLHHIGVTLTAPRLPIQPARGSQEWHRDTGGIRTATLFVHLSDVDNGSGPFHVISSEHLSSSCRIPQTEQSRIAHARLDKWFRSRLTDDEIMRFVPLDAIDRIEGPVGTSFLVDQHSVYHKGGHSTSSDRIMLQIHYSTEARHGEVKIARLFDTLDDDAKAEFLDDETLSFVLRPSQTMFQRIGLPERVYRVWVKYLSFHPAAVTKPTSSLPFD